MGEGANCTLVASLYCECPTWEEAKVGKWFMGLLTWGQPPPGGRKACIYILMSKAPLLCPAVLTFREALE